MKTDVQDIEMLAPGVFANVNKNQYENYRRSSNALKGKNMEISQMKERVSFLEEQVGEIKDLLYKLCKGNY